MADEWYYTQQGQQQGPVAAAQLKQLAASGSLLPTDLVWKEGMANWVPASAARGLFPQSSTSNARAPGSGRTASGGAPASGRPAVASGAPASGRSSPGSGGPASARPRRAPIHVTPIDDEEEYDDDEEAPRERQVRRRSQGLSTGTWVAIVGGSVGALLLIGVVILLIVLLSRPGVTGPATFTETVALGKHNYTVTFRGGQPAQFTIAGDGKSDVEIRVYERNNRLVTSNFFGMSDNRAVSWLPPQTETYRIELTNNGPFPDRLRITHN